MATYYVSKSGSDANNGLGADASAVTNKPWLTIGKALGASGIASGDTVYIGPGVYRETVTVAMTSATAETKVYGDPANRQGFKDGSGVLVAAAPVRWTAWTTDDKTTPAATVLLALAARDFLTFQDIFLVGTSAGAAVISSTSTQSTNITFRRCLLHSPTGSASNRVVSITSSAAPANVTLSWLFDSCIVIGLYANATFDITASSSASADYDLDIVFQNCFIQNFNNTFLLSKGGANSFLGGGLKVYNCTIISATNNFNISASSVSTTFPIKVYNNVLICNNVSLSGGTTGQIVEDYNAIYAPTARSNVTAGANSVTSYCPLFNFGQGELWGFYRKFPFSPTFDSPWLGFGASGSGPTLTTDALGRDRPSGSGITWANVSKAVGWMEHHDFAVKESSVTDAGDGWKLTGPGDQKIDVPVDATSTTISVKVRYDTNHGTTNKPQAELLVAEDLGVNAGEIKTATVGVDTWETLTFSAITPTSKGWVTIYLRSRSAAGNGIAYFDTVTVT